MPRHHPAVARRVEHVLLEPRVAAGEHLLRGLLLGVVVVGPQVREQPAGPTAGLAAEQAGQFEGVLPAVGPLAGDGVRIDARARDPVELGTDVDDPTEQVPPLLEARMDPQAPGARPENEGRGPTGADPAGQ